MDSSDQSKAVQLRPLQAQGNQQEALQLLDQARDLEFSQITSLDDLVDTAACQQYAIHLKKPGDLPGAKAALLKSKEMMRHLQESTKVPPTTIPSTKNSFETSPNNGSGRANDFENDSQEIDPLDLESDTATDRFSDAEMLDLEMIQEFLLMGDNEHFPVPSLADYQTKIRNCQQVALECKQRGDTPRALQELRRKKQFQTVHGALASALATNNAVLHAGDHHQWLNELSMEQIELLREIENDPAGGGGLLAQTSQQEQRHVTALDWEDVVEMDADTLRNAIELGMKVPSLAEFQGHAEKKRSLAVSLKQNGDLEGAKVALVEFKTLTQRSKELESLLRSMDDENSKVLDGKVNQSKEILEEDLERLLKESEVALNPSKSQSTPAAELPQPKTSNELKQEAIRLRDAKKISEATQVLKLYKQALDREAQEAEVQAQKQLRKSLHAEIKLAETQQHRSQMYQALVNSHDATQQLEAWSKYAEACRNAEKVLEAKGSKALSIRRGPNAALLVVPEDLTDIAERAIDPAEDRLEIMLLDVCNLHQNKVYAKFQQGPNLGDGSSWKVRAHVCIQLPLNANETEKHISCFFDSETMHSVLNSNGILAFAAPRTQHVSIFPRTGASAPPDKAKRESKRDASAKFEQAVLRRMERRKISISLTHEPVKSTKKASWFSSTSSPEKDGEQDTVGLILGKVVLETKDLLARRCLVGEYPLLGKGQREAGGTLRLCFRTGIPFLLPNEAVNADSNRGSPKLTELSAYQTSLYFSANTNQ